MPETRNRQSRRTGSPDGNLQLEPHPAELDRPQGLGDFEAVSDTIAKFRKSRNPKTGEERTHHLLEEEARVFYVAVTRARKQLFICYPTRLGGYRKMPSPFLEYFDPECVST